MIYLSTVKDVMGRHFLLILFWANVLFFIGVDIYYPNFDPLLTTYLSSVCIGFSLLFWFLADAKSINYKPSKAFQYGVILTSFISVPYYLLKYKGIKRSLLSFLLFLLCLLITMLAVVGIEYLYSPEKFWSD